MTTRPADVVTDPPSAAPPQSVPSVTMRRMSSDRQVVVGVPNLPGGGDGTQELVHSGSHIRCGSGQFAHRVVPGCPTTAIVVVWLRRLRQRTAWMAGVRVSSISCGLPDQILRGANPSVSTCIARRIGLFLLPPAPRPARAIQQRGLGRVRQDLPWRAVLIPRDAARPFFPGRFSMSHTDREMRSKPITSNRSASPRLSPGQGPNRPRLGREVLTADAALGHAPDPNVAVRHDRAAPAPGRPTLPRVRPVRQCQGFL